MKRNPGQIKQNLVKKIIAGKIVKRYRCRTALMQVTGLDVRHLKNDKTVELVKFRRNQETRDKVKDKVLEFLMRDDISRCMPGKQDAVKNSGEMKQIRILNDYLRNLHDKFLAENPEIKCSLSLFCKLRPSHVKLTSLISRSTCHQNMAMKLKCLKLHSVNISANPEVTSRSVMGSEMEAMLQTMTGDDIEFESWKRIECKDGKKTYEDS